MSSAITIKLPKYVDHFVDRHGHARFYFRRKGGPRISMPGLPWTPEFMAAYTEAVENRTLVPIPRGLRSIVPGSVDAAIVAYLASPSYLEELAPKSRKFRKSILEAFSKSSGPGRLKHLKREHVQAIIAKLSPAAQGNWMKALRHWIKFCLKANLIDVSPLNDIIRSKAVDTGGFRPWTEDDVTRYCGFYPLGTVPRLAMEIMLNLGVRVSDAAVIGPAHIRAGLLDDYLPVKTTNSGGRRITIRLRKPLLDAIAAMTVTGAGTFLVSDRGRKFSAEYLSEKMRGWCDAAGVPACTSHGLRKLCLTRLAETGMDPFAIQAVSGHKNLKEIQTYVDSYSRKVAAARAMDMMDAVERKRVPTPAPRVGNDGK